MTTYSARLPGSTEIVKAKKSYGCWLAGGDKAPEATLIQLENGAWYELRGAVLKFFGWEI